MKRSASTGDVLSAAVRPSPAKRMRSGCQIDVSKELPPAPTCSVCLTSVEKQDDFHFCDLTGICPKREPCQLCATCFRRCLEACVHTLNTSSPAAEVLQCLGSAGRIPVCIACRRSAARGPGEGGAHYNIESIEQLVLGDPTCRCVDCAHARGGPAAAAAAEETYLMTPSPTVSKALVRMAAAGAGVGAGAGTPATTSPLDLDTTASITAPWSEGGMLVETGTELGQPNLIRGQSITVIPPLPLEQTSSVQDRMPLGNSQTGHVPLASVGTMSYCPPVPTSNKYLGAPMYARRLWRQVLSRRALHQLAHRCPFGVFKRCPVPGCDSQEYIIYDERSQFMRFAECDHEVCRNCEKQVTETGHGARRAHNRKCMVTLGSQLVRKARSWNNWSTTPNLTAAVKAMYEYMNEVVSRRQRLECPRCGVVVAKTGSCNHIVCECGEHLCQACHRRLADRLPHPMVKAANAHAVAPYGTYVAVDEMAMVQNHYEVGGWKRQEPQKRLCPRMFAEVAEWFPTVLNGRTPAPGQTAPVGLHDDSDAGDQMELNRHSQAVRLRILALMLNRRVVTKEALQVIVEYDKEHNRGMLMDMWPSYPMLGVHELMYVLWEWGRVDRTTTPDSGSARNCWVYVPQNHVFTYDPRADYKPVNVMEVHVFSESGGREAINMLESLRVVEVVDVTATQADMLDGGGVVLL